METSKSAQPLTRRFIAGLTLDDAIHVCRNLKSQGFLTSLDHLGENVHTLQEATDARNAYLTALQRLSAEELPATVSMKVTSLGLDVSEEACYENTEALVMKAQQTGTRIEFDMESSIYVDRTLRLVHKMHERFGSVRAVIQAYLYRSAADIEDLSAAGIPIRLCKGAYREPPSIAFPRKEDVDANYSKLMRLLFHRGTYPAIASHDERIIDEALRIVKDREIQPDQFEFQMLYGVRRDLQKKLVAQGYRVRVYVPYGVAWYPYFMRRLAERPANAIFILKNVFRA
jgi:proline dehydrogenase